MNHNTYARATKNYNIVEDLAQAPSTMSIVKVLQNFRAQRKALLSSIGGIDPQDYILAIFNMEKCKPCLSHELIFQVQVVSKSRPIHHTFIDKGALTCIIPTTCWLALGYPTLYALSNSLKAFDGHTFLLKGYLASYPINLSGKRINVDIEVIDRHFDYNLLLGRSWSYVMATIVSLVLQFILFPLDGKIVTVDQLSFYTPDYSMLPSIIIKLIGGVPNSYFRIDIDLLKEYSLMGCVTLPPPEVSQMVSLISTISNGSINP